MANVYPPSKAKLLMNINRIWSVSDYSCTSWFKVRRSNIFIIPFAVLVLIIYSTITQGLTFASTLGSLLVGGPVGYIIALGETHSVEIQRICKRHPMSFFLFWKTLRLALQFSLLFSMLMPIFMLLDSHIIFMIFSVGLQDFLKTQFIELIGISLVISFVANLFVEVNRKLGPGVLLSLITGRYHQPRAQERIFLFLDMKNSTTLAESLGDLKYSSFLQDFFYDIAETISLYKGEVYQYVGDEVVISWKVEDGFKDNRCVNCFLAIQDRISQVSGYYRETYGYIPEFKAGIHSGAVVIAEVGKIKSEIAYHGDVLNTTSRIVDLCRTLKHDLLISSEAYNALKLDQMLYFEELGSFFLKGKTREITLYSIERQSAVQQPQKHHIHPNVLPQIDLSVNKLPSHKNKELLDVSSMK